MANHGQSGFDPKLSVAIGGNRVAYRETLLQGLGRIRNVATGRDGLVYLLFEYQPGSRIVRPAPVC